VRAVLVELTPYDPIGQARVTLRICNANDASVTLVSGGPGEFKPVLSAGPTISRSVFNGDFSGGGVAAESLIGVALDEQGNDQWMSYVWGDAGVKIWTGNVGDPFSAYTLRWTVAAAGIERSRGLQAKITLRPLARLNRPVLFQSYAGTDNGTAGDVGEGRIDIKGTLKPWLSGNGRYVRPVLLDGSRQIYCYHAYSPTAGATNCFEGGSDKGAPAFTWADYPTMMNAVLTQTQWGHCPALGMIRLGGQPSFPITVHAGGDAPAAGSAAYVTTADIINRLLTVCAGLSLGAANQAALNTARPDAIDVFLDAQDNLESLLTKLMLGINGYWLEGEDGTILLGTVPPALTGAAPTRALNTDGGDYPAVVQSTEEVASPPIYRLRLGGRATHYPHAVNEVVASIATTTAIANAAQNTANQKTRDFPASAVAPTVPAPQEGDLWPDTSGLLPVTRRYDSGSTTWVRVATVGADANGTVIDSGNAGGTITLPRNEVRTSLGTAAAITGQAPTATSADFSVVIGATKPANNATVGGDVNGVNIIDSSVNASPLSRVVLVTSAGTAALIAGQGALATKSAANYDSDVVDGTTYKRYQLTERTKLTGIAPNADVTSANVAASVTGQGALATKASVAYGSAYVTGFGALAARAHARLGLELYRADDVTLVNDVDAITNQGTAANIAGQGALATKGTVTYGTGDVTGFGALAARVKLALGDGFIFRADGTTGLTDAIAVTSLGTAANITGQGTFATKSSADYGADVVGTKPPAGATVGADINANVIDSAVNTTPLARATLLTSLGTAANVAGQGTFATKNYLYFGMGGALTEDAGQSIFATLANFKTNQGTAANIAGQGALATKATVTYGTGDVTGFGVLASRAKIALGDGYVFKADGATALTDAIAVTSLGVAASIAGQGALATKATVDYSADVSGTKPPSNATVGADINSANLIDSSVGTTPLTRAVVLTALGTAANIQGQSALATLTPTSLSQITPTIGTLRTTLTGQRVEIADNLIQVFDAAGVVRVKIGIF
jgi:hypothetical protein